MLSEILGHYENSKTKHHQQGHPCEERLQSDGSHGMAAKASIPLAEVLKNYSSPRSTPPWTSLFTPLWTSLLASLVNNAYCDELQCCRCRRCPRYRCSNTAFSALQVPAVLRHVVSYLDSSCRLVTLASLTRDTWVIHRQEIMELRHHADTLAHWLEHQEMREHFEDTINAVIETQPLLQMLALWMGSDFRLVTVASLKRRWFLHYFKGIMELRGLAVSLREWEDDMPISLILYFREQERARDLEREMRWSD